MQLLCAILVGLLLCVFPTNLHAESRFALLIGNQAYTDKIGPLTNPHNDIALVGAALEKIGFKVVRVKDAGYKAIDTALKQHIQQVRRAGRDAISFVYYSGHGASDPDTEINYLIPIDVEGSDEASVWTNSIELSGIVNKLRDQSPNATHFVVFDACREELHLTHEGKKAMGERGFVALGNVPGVMIAYATAPGRTASDVGQGSGPYAKSLAEEIVKPGVEAVTMFRNVQLKVRDAIGQDPWLSFPALPPIYFAGNITPERAGTERQIEIAYWDSVKDNKDPAVLAAYLARYPKGEFASTAQALIVRYEQQLRAERAARDEQGRRQQDATKAAEARRHEDERGAQEAALTADRQRAEEIKESHKATSQEDGSRPELGAVAKELRNALEEIRIAREAAKAAEEQRAAATRAAEEATSRAKLASLPPAEGQHRSAEKLADDPVALTRALQTELNRVGCDPGELDGVWSVKAKDALANFARLAKKTLPSDSPTPEALQAVFSQRGRICALPSGAHQKKHDGTRAATAQDLLRAAKGGGESTNCKFAFGKRGGAGQGNIPRYRCQ